MIQLDNNPRTCKRPDIPIHHLVELFSSLLEIHVQDFQQNK